MLVDVIEQAAALERVLAGESASGLAGFAAILKCSSQLRLLGEGARAVSLLESATVLLGEEPPSARLRYSNERLRALLTAQRYSEALELSQALFAEPTGLPAGHVDVLAARLLEAQCLWRTNRTEDSLHRLGLIRAELLGRPDSELLAECAVNIASAHVRRGNWDGAREYSVEAWVSARRLNSDLLQGMALGNLCIAERGRCRWAAAEEAGASAVEALVRAGALAAADHARRSLAIAQLKLGKWKQVLESTGGLIDANVQRSHQIV